MITRVTIVSLAVHTIVAHGEEGRTIVWDAINVKPQDLKVGVTYKVKTDDSGKILEEILDE